MRCESVGQNFKGLNFRLKPETLEAVSKSTGLSQKELLNESLSQDRVDLYSINSFLEKNIDYILPSNYYLKNMKKLIMQGKIFTLEKQYQKEKGTAVLNQLLDNILK